MRLDLVSAWYGGEWMGGGCGGEGGGGCGCEKGGGMGSGMRATPADRREGLT
jgi:hypothetical protein